VAARTGAVGTRRNERRSSTTVGGALFLVVFPYHYIALRRVFGGSRWRSFAKGTAVGVLYWLTMALVMLILVRVTTRGLA